MKVFYEDEELRFLIETGKSRKFKSFSKDRKFMLGLSRVTGVLLAAESTEELKAFSWLHYERLKHIGLSSVRILNGRVERLLFKEIEDGVEIKIIEINTTHYGNKK